MNRRQLFRGALGIIGASILPTAVLASTTQLIPSGAGGTLDDPAGLLVEIPAQSVGLGQAYAAVLPYFGDRAKCGYKLFTKEEGYTCGGGAFFVGYDNKLPAPMHYVPVECRPVHMKGNYGHWYGQTWQAAIDNCVSYNEWFKTYTRRFGHYPYRSTISREGLKPFRASAGNTMSWRTEEVL